MVALYALSIIVLLSITKSVEISGWVYVDNWFQLYFNGEKVAQDPMIFKPHNAVKVNFTAPDSGLYSFALWAQDYADDVTGLESRNGGTCLGDGGIRITLSDGTISSSDWKCFIVMQGPENDECVITDECTNDPDLCTVTYNDYPSCWNETYCSDADSWSSATEYTDVDGWGVPTPCTSADDCLCCGCGSLEIEDCTAISDPDIPSDCFTEYPDGCAGGQQDWGDSSFMWTGDLNVHNRIICRYSYCVGDTTNCTAISSPTSSPTSSSDGDLDGAQAFGILIAIGIGFINILC